MDELLALRADQILLIGLPFAIRPQGFLLAAASLVPVIIRNRGYCQKERCQKKY
jgi:hypothetical protein